MIYKYLKLKFKNQLNFHKQRGKKKGSLSFYFNSEIIFLWYNYSKYPIISKYLQYNNLYYQLSSTLVFSKIIF